MMLDKLMDLAFKIGALDGHWECEGIRVGDASARKEIEQKYTDTEIEEATRIMLKQLSFSQLESNIRMGQTFGYFNDNSNRNNRLVNNSRNSFVERKLVSNLDTPFSYRSCNQSFSEIKILKIKLNKLDFFKIL